MAGKYEQPLHEQLVDLLREKIENKMEPHEQLPSERELTKTYQVSRNTVRLALDELETMGYVYRQHGRGTFVLNKEREATDLSTTYSFSEQMQAMGKTAETKILYLHTIEANKYIAENLNLPLGAKVYKLKRIRIGDGMPLMVERTYLPGTIFPDFTVDLLNNTALYSVMKDHYHVTIAEANEAFFASSIGANDANLLAVPADSPGLNVQRTTYSDHHNVIEYTLSVARSDQFVYQVHHING
ncbi:GntR family transcriptional regulator [Lacticaseibacillus saniviri]|uniref:Transcriptional regulator, GntR family n=1 Tax=Lacticaseibacillus saniviri JCM 17471 = DSM 24301 TaxID=1293598 RepID=A0A0R2N084_9LACO|nr:GntR family transcriptional regulator [Lacticaseibacillus saniviri]KRO16378.1 transcriptional regulator, GntR family [Lacticaseibacillus saniviri JCM 17471 = DSM 24301]MCG4282218.1 GntR family transcriptional regulator [Lacticaseibacillus saniviri]